MIRRTTFNLSYVVLCTVSIAITLSAVGERGFQSWYLFASPLVLAATFFGMRGALATGCVVFALLVLLFRNEASVAAHPEGLPSAPVVLAQTATFIVSMAEVYGHALAGTLLMVAGAFGIGYLADKQKQLQIQAGFMASHDALTGLMNRWSFHREVEQVVGQVQRTHGSAALVLLDLDGFKQVNDLHGHPAGDEVLKRVGEVLERQSRSNDLAARMGGDEFAVLLPQIDETTARMVAERIVKAIAGIPGDWRVSASAGLALISDAAQDYETVIKQADSALYFAKGTGKNRIHVYGVEDGGREREKSDAVLQPANSSPQ